MNIQTGKDATFEEIHPYRISRQTAQEPVFAPRVVWFTGLSGAGKSTVASGLNQLLVGRGVKTAMLDGESLRSGLCRDLGFGVQARAENVRRVAEVAALMADAGITVLVALISPTRVARHFARSIVGNERFVEVFVDVPLAVAESRNARELCRTAPRGTHQGFIGIDSPYEPPVFPELHLRNEEIDVAGAVEMIDAWLRRSVSG